MVSYYNNMKNVNKNTYKNVAITSILTVILITSSIGVAYAADNEFSGISEFGYIQSDIVRSDFTDFGVESTADNEFTGTVEFGLPSTNAATGDFSAAFGVYNAASGKFSTAFGVGTVSQPYASIALGILNEISGTTDRWVDTDPLFIIGNGVDNGNRHNAVTVLKNGNVGIGTSSPLTMLTVGPNPSTAFNANELFQVAKTGDAYMTIRDGTANALLGTTSGLPFVGSQSNHDFTIRTNNGEKVRITSGGNIGIGTTTPDAKLDVNGDIKLSGDIISDGYICIGTC